MPIKKYFANSDNVINNTYKGASNEIRNTGSNAGVSDIIETYSLYNRRGAEGQELARSLIKFPVSDISADRAAGKIPASGSVTFKLKLYNAKHYYSTPFNYDIQVAAVSVDWQEGLGSDLENYSHDTKDQLGSNWMKRSGNTSWTTPGGDFHTDASSSFTKTITGKTEDLEVDVTTLVEQWIDSVGNVLGSKDNYGFIIKLTNEYEAHYSSSTGTFSGSLLHNPNGTTKSYYRKMFFGRGTEFFFKRPIIEAQFATDIKDDRNKFYISSSLKQSYSENLNRLYFYNTHNSNLIDIGGSNSNLPTVQFYYSSGSVPEGTAQGVLNSAASAVTSLTATRASTGTYYVDLAVTKSVVTSTYPYLVDVWSYGGMQVLTGSAITLLPNTPDYSSVKNNYILSIPNLLPEYYKNDNARLRLYARNKKWSPSIYTVSKDKPEGLTVTSAYYRILRSIDDYEVVPYGTGSVKYTELPYDSEGNYFDLDMNILEPGYQYMIKIAFYDEYTKQYQEQPYEFKFRVVD